MPDFTNNLDQVRNLNQIAKADNVTINNFNQVAAEAPDRVQVMPPFKPLLYPIIGRADLVNKIVAALEAGRRTLAVLHLPGIGKTTLATLLAKDARLQEKFPDGLLWAHLGLDPDVRAELRKWAYALNVPENRMKDFETPQQWSEAVAQAIGKRRMLLIVDDVWEADAAGDYFLLGGDNCAHVITTRYPSVATGMTEIGFEVRKLDKADGIALLSNFAPDAVASEPAAAADLVESVDGLPLALVLMGHYLRQAGKFKETDRISAAVDALQDIQNLFQLQMPSEYPADTPRSLAGVIEASYRTLGKRSAWQIKPLSGDALRNALESLSILRPDPARFRPELAELLFEAPRSALDELCDAGLIEVVHVENKNNGKDMDADTERYTMHRTVAEYIRMKLTPERAKTLHLHAAGYYREQLSELEEEHQKEGSSYQGWYRYENIAWQDCMDNWLYHLSKTDEKRLAVIAFLRAWFDGFWWWGCFLDFNFCNQLLREWGQRKVVPEAEQGLLLLSRFMDAYPKETADRNSENWQQVESLLNEIRQRAQLDGDPALIEDEDARHVRGMTSIFLAEAHRFGRRDYPTAETFYRDALALFQRDNDTWDTAWVLYHLADMLCQCTRHDEATALCQQAFSMSAVAEDPEVTANLYRVQGDIYRGQRNLDAAVSSYGLAVENAYRFQVEPEEPDSYTIRFYVQIAEQVCSRLIDMQTHNEGNALKMSLSLRRTWLNDKFSLVADAAEPDVALLKRDVAALAACLFPATLAADALKDKGEDYALAVKGNLANVQQFKTSAS